MDPESGSAPAFSASEPLLDTGAYVASRDSKRLIRLQERKGWNEEIAARLAEIGYGEMAARLVNCQAQVDRLKYRLPDGSVTYRHQASERCQCRLCQPCAARRAARLQFKYRDALAQFAEGLYGHHLVLTLKNSEHLPDRRRVSKLLRNLWRSKVWKQYGGIAGGLYSIETTYNKESGGFHAHVHCLIFTRAEMPYYNSGRQFWTQEANQAIADVWLRLTGDSFIVRGQKWNGETKEMLKYMAKGSELVGMGNDALAEYVAWTHRARMVSTFGKLYGLAGRIEKEMEMLEKAEQELDLDEYAPATIGAVLEEVVVLQWDRNHRRYVAVEVRDMRGMTNGERQILPGGRRYFEGG